MAYPSGYSLHFAYDAAGRRTNLADQAGFGINYAYDTLGRLAAVSDAQGVLLASYTYDSAGRLAQRNMGTNGWSLYTYTASGLIRSVVNQTAAGDDPVAL